MPAIPMSQATAVLLSDGWHTLTPNTFAMVLDPSFTDPDGVLITPGEPWVQFEDNSTPAQIFACPVRCVLGVKMAALQTP